MFLDLLVIFKCSIIYSILFFSVLASVEYWLRLLFTVQIISQKNIIFTLNVYKFN